MKEEQESIKNEVIITVGAIAGFIGSISANIYLGIINNSAKDNFWLSLFCFWIPMVIIINTIITLIKVIFDKKRDYSSCQIFKKALGKYIPEYLLIGILIYIYLSFVVCEGSNFYTNSCVS